MALDTYDNLKAEIAEWLNRQDLTAKIPTFITLTETQIERTLRVRQMMARTSLTVDAQYEDLPADYLALHNAQLNTTPVQELQYVPLNELDKVRARYYNTTGRPRYYSIVGDQIEFAPAPDTSYDGEIVYYQKIDRLGDATQTNWLLEDYPDLYLFGALMNAAPYLEDDPRVAMWGQGMQNILEDIRIADERGRAAAGSPIKMRIRPYGGTKVT